MAPPRGLTFGLMISRATDFPTMISAWHAAEASGYDALYVGDHLWSTTGTGAESFPRYDCWTVLAALAQSTTAIRIGSYMSSMDHRYPSVVAKQAITIDHLSNGRLTLGLGAGGNPRDLAAGGRLGVDSGQSRSQRFAEYVEVVRGLLEEPTFAYSGRTIAIDAAVRNPPPVQRPRPPLTIAAHSRSSLIVAAHHADTWASYGISLAEQRTGRAPTPDSSLGVTKTRSETLAEEAIRIGRDPSTIGRSFLAGFTGERPIESSDSFTDFVGRYAEAGINEFVFPYPDLSGPGVDLFERIGPVLATLKAGSRK